MADWFRSWHGAPIDPKWRTIARRADARPGDVAAIVWCLLDRASQSKIRGCIDGYDIEVIADTLGYDVDMVDRVIKALYDKQIIDSTHYFSAWRERQPEREDGSAERSRAWRDARRTHPNASERNATRVNDPDTDTDTEKKDTSSLREEGVADAPPDERTILFREGVPAVSRITGKPSASARSLVARWLKLTGDDCIAVRRLIEDAERERPVEPVSWIEARLRPVQSTGPPRRTGNGFAAAGLELLEQHRERRRDSLETITLDAENPRF